MSVVKHVWYERLSKDLRIDLTPDMLAFMECWQEAEGGEATHNPWNSTEPADGATPYNTFDGDLHVWNYPTMESGVEATVKILSQTNFHSLLTAMREGQNPYACAHALGHVPWGTSSALVVQLLERRGVDKSHEPKSPPAEHR